MFGINNQYLLDFSINGKRDFIQTVEFSAFELTEEAGNVLPSFKLTFLSSDYSLKSYINEGTVLQATFGKDYNSLHNIELVTALSDVAAPAEGKRLFTLQGVQNKLKYVNVLRTRHSKKESAFEVIKKVAGDYFLVDARPSESLDKQVWIQSSMTDRNFVNHLWMHSDHGNGFPMIGICSLNNEFIMRSSTELFSSEPKWYFTPEGGISGNRIYYEAGYQIRNASAFFNSIKGYERQNYLIDREEGEVKSFISTTRPGLAPGGKLNQAPNLNVGIGTIAPVTDNMHPKFYEAYSKNVQALMIYSSFRVQLHFRNVFIPIKVLDLAMFIETFGPNKQVDEYSSGLYIVTKVTRMFSGQQFATYVTLSREAPGGMV